MMPLELRKNEKFSVSALKLLKKCIYKADISNYDFLLENTGQVRIWFQFDDFLKSYASRT